MMARKIVKLAALVGFLSIVLGLVSACTSGVSQQDYDAVKQQLAAREKELQEAKAQTKNVVLSVVPNAPPRGTPAPLPPGVTPPPPPIPPAARTVPLYIYVDTVVSGPGESKFNVDGSRYCIKSSVFKRGQHIVWRMEVVDTSTGKILQAADMDKAVLRLPHGEEATFRYGRHGAEGIAWFWTATWDVPMDYPLGSLDTSITVTTKAGKSEMFKEPLTVRTVNYRPGIDLDTRVFIVE